LSFQQKKLKFKVNNRTTLKGVNYKFKVESCHKERLQTFGLETVTKVDPMKRILAVPVVNVPTTDSGVLV
jgi:hypothetical protein